MHSMTLASVHNIYIHLSIVHNVVKCHTITSPAPMENVASRFMWLYTLSITVINKK